jgi:site-specific DNA-methyltransferase (adenine-specific)
MIELNKIIHADVLEGLKLIEDNSIDCIITSPPYYQLRDYGFSEQWGLEKTYQEYLDKMIMFMSECKRVIKPEGTIWINLGDSYNTESGNMKQKVYSNTKNTLMNGGKINKEDYCKSKTLQGKSLMLIPHRFAIRCIDELGLILRNDIIWAKPNGMPESVTDRFSKKHEFFFFFVKSKKYYFDLDGVRGKHNAIPKKQKPLRQDCWNKQSAKSSYSFNDYNPNGKNPGDVADFWSITTKGSSEKHYATFNSELIDKPIVAGSPEFVCVKCGKAREKIIEVLGKCSANNCSKRSLAMGHTANGPTARCNIKADIKNITGYTDCNCNAGFIGGTVLDPFAGTGTTLIRALELGRNVIGIEGDKDYFEKSVERINKELIKIKMF